MFDARAYYATLESPTFIAPSGKVYVGQILGTDTWQRLNVKLRHARRENGTFEPSGLNVAMRLICDATFPRKWWKPWEKTVAHHVWEMPEIGRMRAVWDFMRSQAKSRGTDLPENLGTYQLPMLPLDKQDGLLDVPPMSGS
jgi:hypothetical protein